MRGEEPDHLPVEGLVEVRPVKAGRRRADRRRKELQLGRTGRHEVVMASAFDPKELRWLRQGGSHGLRIARCWQDLVCAGLPQLDGLGHLGQALAGEGEAKGRRGDHKGLQARIPMDHQGVPGSRTSSRGSLGDQTAVKIVGMGAAVFDHPGHVRLAASCRQHGEPAGRISEGADLLGVDPAPALPRGQHVIDQHRDLARPPAQVGRPALVAPVVARMGQGDDDKARPGQGLGSGEVATEIPSSAVRDDDQGARRRHCSRWAPHTRFDVGLIAVGDQESVEVDRVANRRPGLLGGSRGHIRNGAGRCRQGGGGKRRQGQGGERACAYGHAGGFREKEDIGFGPCTLPLRQR